MLGYRLRAGDVEQGNLAKMQKLPLCPWSKEERRIGGAGTHPMLCLQPREERSIGGAGAQLSTG